MKNEIMKMYQLPKPQDYVTTRALYFIFKKFFEYKDEKIKSMYRRSKAPEPKKFGKFDIDVTPVPDNFNLPDGLSHDNSKLLNVILKSITKQWISTKGAVEKTTKVYRSCFYLGKHENGNSYICFLGTVIKEEVDYS